jgi:hypothetical protein
MKKTLLMVLLLISTVSADVIVEMQGTQNQTQGIMGGKEAILVFIGGCNSDWQSTTQCLTNDTLVRIYNDANGCWDTPPADNGTFIGWCNYCSQNIITTEIDACPAYDGESTRNISAYDANWQNCCAITNLSDDCYQDDTATFNRTYYDSPVCEEATDMWDLAVIILPALFGIFLIVGAVSLGTDHNIIRIFMYLLSFMTIFVSMNYASIIIGYRYPEFAAIQDALGQTVFWAGRIIFVFIFYFVIYLLVKMMHAVRQKNKERLQY